MINKFLALFKKKKIGKVLSVGDTFSYYYCFHNEISKQTERKSHCGFVESINIVNSIFDKSYRISLITKNSRMVFDLHISNINNVYRANDIAIEQMNQSNVRDMDWSTQTYNKKSVILIDPYDKTQQKRLMKLLNKQIDVKPCKSVFDSMKHKRLVLTEKTYEPFRNC